MLSASGVLASSSLGWPSIFYISGGSGLVWAAAWMVFGSNSPAEYKNISPEEKMFIEAKPDGEESTKDAPANKNLSTPWRSIFTSVPFISLIIVHCAHNWGFWTLLTEMPNYMKNVLGLDIKHVCVLVYSVVAVFINKIFFLFRMLWSRQCPTSR